MTHIRKAKKKNPHLSVARTAKLRAWLWNHFRNPWTYRLELPRPQNKKHPWPPLSPLLSIHKSFPKGVCVCVCVCEG